MSVSTLAPCLARPRPVGQNLDCHVDGLADGLADTGPGLPGREKAAWRGGADLGCSAVWAAWAAADARLAGVASLDEALQGWERGASASYAVVAALTALGSRRGGDDDEAALAVVVMLRPGIARLAKRLGDVCELDDVRATVWEEVKLAEPQVGDLAARHLLLRAHQRLTRPGAGMVTGADWVSLDQLLGGSTARGRRAASVGWAGTDLDVVVSASEVGDPAGDVVDLLTWARKTGVIGSDELELLVELLAAAGRGVSVQEAQRLVGEQLGVGIRTVRRRRDAAVSRLRGAAADYLAAIA